MESGAPPRRCLAGVGGSHRPLAGPTRPLEPDPPVTRTRTTYATTSGALGPPERLRWPGVAPPPLRRPRRSSEGHLAPPASRPARRARVRHAHDAPVRPPAPPSRRPIRAHSPAQSPLSSATASRRVRLPTLGLGRPRCAHPPLGALCASLLHGRASYPFRAPSAPSSGPSSAANLVTSGPP